jgi:hypothetical protein
MTFGAFAWVVSAGQTFRILASEDINRPSITQPEDATLLGTAAPANVECPACHGVFSDDALSQGFARGSLRCACGQGLQVRAVPPNLDPTGSWSALIGETSRDKGSPSDAPVKAEPFFLWVDSALNDRLEARERRARRRPGIIALVGGGIALAAGLGTWASGAGWGGGLGVFCTVGVIELFVLVEVLSRRAGRNHP